MNLKTLSKIKRELLQIYKSPQGRKALEFESFAKQLGRYKDNRGKEPTYTRERDPALAPPFVILWRWLSIARSWAMNAFG